MQISRAPSKRLWPRRIVWVLGWLFVIAGILILSLRFFITTQMGARFIESQINKRSFGPVERIEISGLSGDPLGDFDIENVKIYDKDGLWSSADNISVDWDAYAALRQELDFKSIRIDELSLLRQPALNPSDPEADFNYSIKIGEADVKNFAVSENILPEAATFSLSSTFRSEASGVIEARLNAVQKNKDGDSVVLDFGRSEAGLLSGDFQLNGTSNGTLATLMKAPANTLVVGQGVLNGTIEKGGGTATITFAGTQQISIQSEWSPDIITAEGSLSTENWPVFDAVRPSIGTALDFSGTVDRTAANLPFGLSVQSRRSSVSARGEMGETISLPRQARIDARTENLGRLLPLPEGLAFGATRAQGSLSIREGLDFDGQVNIADIATPYGSADRIKGPMRVAQASDGVFSVSTNAEITALSTEQTIPIALANKTQVDLQATLNSGQKTITNITGDLESGANRIKVKGRTTFDATNMMLSGTVSAVTTALGAVPAGRLQTTYKVEREGDVLPAISAEGAFKPAYALAPPLGQMLDGGVNFEVNAAPIEGGLRLSQARVNGENLTVAAAGTITEQLFLQGEALISAPIDYQSVKLSGATEASFTITGPKTSPSVKVDARAAAVETSQVSLNNVRLRADVSDILSAPRGPLRLTGDTEYGPLDASAQFASQNQTFAAQDIDITLGQLSANGYVAVTRAGLATGQLALDLPQDGDRFARAKLDLSAEGGEQRVAFDAKAANAAYGPINFDTFSATANGTLSSLSGEIVTSGFQEDGILNRKFSLDAPLTVTRTPDGKFEARITPDARYGAIDLKAQSPVIASYQNGDIAVAANLTLSGAPAKLDYARTGSGETLAVDIQDVAMRLLPLPALLADTRGRFGVTARLASAPGTGVSGTSEIRLNDWRGFDIKSGEGLSGVLDVSLQGSQAKWGVTAKAQNGEKPENKLTMLGDGTFAMTTAQSFAGLRADMTAPVSGKIDINGAMRPLLELIAAKEAEASGTLTANLTLSGTASAPEVDGTANGRAIRMEAPQLGTTLRDGRFNLDFSNRKLKIDDFYLSDNKGGSLSGTGDFTLGEFGRPLGTLKLSAKDFRALNRKDLEGRVAGTLQYESLEERAVISGDLELLRTEVKQFVAGNASVIEIEVTEVNAPESASERVVEIPALPIELDIKVTAPRRIFVRSKGLDVEMSVDIEIKGTVSAPKIYGRADVLRGGYRIAGKELAFESGYILFDGDLADAQVNLIANTETPTISAGVKITGTVEEPEIELSSTPERPDDEILSALLFGRSATELSGIEAAQLAGALAQFSGAGSGFNLLGGLRDALGVGQLSIGVGENGGAQITGGRYLTKNVYLQVFSGGDSDETGAIIDWEVRKNISLRSKVQADSEHTFALKWKKDF